MLLLFIEYFLFNLRQFKFGLEEFNEFVILLPNFTVDLSHLAVKSAAVELFLTWKSEVCSTKAMALWVKIKEYTQFY